MRSPNILCIDILLASTELAMLWEEKSAYELTALLGMEILKTEKKIKSRVDDIIFQNAMEWMMYLENKERSDLKNKTPEEILSLFEEMKINLNKKESL